MAAQTDYFDLLDWLEEQHTLRPQQFFERMKEAFGLAHLLYLDVAVTAAGLIVHRLQHTLDAQTTRAFPSLGIRRLEPVLRMALCAVKPLDWGTLARRLPAAEPLFTLVRDQGMPTQGVCYPLPSREGRAALLVANVACGGHEWARFRRLHDRDIQALGAHFHAAILDRDGTTRQHGDPALPALTRRELETLHWSAAGKSYWEIAVILGISERTVRFFMANARRKLNVVSNTQAVAEAVWHGILSHR